MLSVQAKESSIKTRFLFIFEQIIFIDLITGSGYYKYSVNL